MITPGKILRRLRRRLKNKKFFLLLAMLGPGVITAFGGNDASGIIGYSSAGAQYKYNLLWSLILVMFSLGVCQEMCARMGAVTGKGLADLIREEYGVKITLFAMIALLVANFATTISEFAGIAFGLEAFLPEHQRWLVRLVAVPLVALGIWALVTRSSYERVNKILLSASLVYIAYLFSAFLAHPDWSEVFHQTISPDLSPILHDRDYLFTLISVIGTTITPWGQFYIQSSMRDRKTSAEQYSPIDPLFGAFAAILVAFLIAVSCGATIFKPGIPVNINDAGDLARALQPVAGKSATLLFVVGLFNASCFGAITVPLSTAYAVTESLGSESGLGRRVREAPLFIGVFTGLIFVSALVVMFGGKNLAALMILPNIVGAVLLPIILILMLRLVNNPRLMGKYVNSKIYNLIAWTTTIVLIILSVALFVSFFIRR